MRARFYQACYDYPGIFFIFTVVSIFASELLIMLFLYKWANLVTGILDATLLSLMVAPALYVLLYMPLIKNLQEYKDVEIQLIDVNHSLEEMVSERTSELSRVNRLLETEYLEELKLSEERCRNVIDNLGVGVAVIDPDMKVISANHKMHSWRPYVDFSNNPICYKAFISEDKQKVCENCPVQATFKNQISNRAIIVVEVDGNKRSFRIIASPVKDKHGNIVAVTEVVEDVTKQKNYNENLEQVVRERTSELVEAEGRYRSLIQNSAEGIYVFDPRTLKVQEANKQLQALLGYTQEETENLSLTDFVVADKENIEHFINQMFNEHKKINVNRQYKGKDGSIIDVEVSASLIQYGKTEVCLVNVRDIRERKSAEEALNKSIYELTKTLYASVDALVNLTEKRDPYTAGHQKRVAKLATLLANEMGLEDSQIESIRLAGTLHDIGKIYVPTDILNKPGHLTDMEMGIIKAHSQASYEIIEKIPFKNNVAEIVLQHHERLDGSGYPQGLKDHQILIGAKILGVADVVEAMSSHRPYRPAIGWELALKEIEEKKGIIYDSDVVEACLRLSDLQGGYLQKILEGVV